MGWFDTFKKDFRKDYVNKILINSSEAADAIRHLVEDENLVENKRDLTHVDSCPNLPPIPEQNCH